MKENVDDNAIKTKVDMIGKEWLKLFFDTPINLLCIFDKNRNIFEYNPAWEELLGYEPGEMLGRSPYDFTHPDDIQSTKKIYAQAVEGRVNIYSNRIRCSDGSYRTFEWRTLLSDGYIFASAVDITERVHAKKILREKEERYEKLVSSMSDGLWVIDSDGKFYEVNESACRSTGYTREELLKLSVYDLDMTLYPELYRKMYNNIIKNNKMVYHGVHRRKDGSKFEVEIVSGAIEFNDVKYLLCATRDMSERKKAQQALVESERKFRTVVDQSSDIIFICGTDGAIQDCNKAASEILKYENDELLNMNIHKLFMNQSTPDHKKIMTSDTVVVMTKQFGKKDGGTFIGDMRTRIIEFGNSKHILTVIRDITEQKQNEEKINYLSFHDSLTELYNRTFFEEEVNRLDTNRQLPISFIMGDVNGLKLTNDVFGHQEGDRLLKVIADIIKGSCRSEDIVARWGGDEYMIMLPCTGERRAEEICRAIKKKCSDYQHIVQGDVIEPSISLGYATKKSAGENIMHTIKKAEDFMYKKKLMESRSMHSSLVASMRSTLYEKSSETQEHANRINMITHKIGEAMELSEEMLSELELFSMLHDIGKVSVDIQLLNKKEKLTNEDWETIRRHSDTGYRIAKSVPELNSIAEFILCHHERWDGKGYPQGLKGDKIPLLSRILSVADAFEVMTAGRPYKKALSKEDAVKEISSNAGKQFDPEIVKVFISKIVSEL